MQEEQRTKLTGFYWYEPENREEAEKTPAQRYRDIVDWAARARSVNPLVFDEVTKWLWGAGAWSEDEMAENRAFFMDGILEKFRKQTVLLRKELNELDSTGVVNKAVFEALDSFERELAGETKLDNGMQEIVTTVFRTFSSLRDEKVRRRFAGGETGPEGTDAVEVYGYINFLKTCDAAIQWALFMPDLAARQQKGFRMETFEYRKYPAMRFIGVEMRSTGYLSEREALIHTLDAMKEYRSGFDYDVILYHHFGRGTEEEPCQALAGRFMAADTPVPEGAVSLEFAENPGWTPGPPYLSQFAFAKFAGDPEAMHKSEGYDVNAMYDVTRNVILGQNVPIPYPEKYWTAEVFFDGLEKDNCTGFLFSVN